MTYPVFRWHIDLGPFYNRALLPETPGLKKEGEDCGKGEDLIEKAQIWVWTS